MFLSAAALTMNHRSYRAALRRPAEVILGRHGFLLGGVYMTWEMIGTRLTDVRFRSGEIPVLEFVISTWSRYGSRERTLRVPVPRGSEASAEHVVAVLRETIPPTQHL